MLKVHLTASHEPLLGRSPLELNKVRTITQRRGFKFKTLMNLALVGSLLVTDEMETCQFTVFVFAVAIFLELDFVFGTHRVVSAESFIVCVEKGWKV